MVIIAIILYHSNPFGFDKFWFIHNDGFRNAYPHNMATWQVLAMNGGSYAGEYKLAFYNMTDSLLEVVFLLRLNTWKNQKH